MCEIVVLKHFSILEPLKKILYWDLPTTFKKDLGFGVGIRIILVYIEPQRTFGIRFFPTTIAYEGSGFSIIEDLQAETQQRCPRRSSC